MDLFDKFVLGGYVAITLGTFVTLVVMVWSDSRKKQK